MKILSQFNDYETAERWADEYAGDNQVVVMVVEDLNDDPTSFYVVSGDVGDDARYEVQYTAGRTV